jgi:hypothetical protein
MLLLLTCATIADCIRAGTRKRDDKVVTLGCMDGDVDLRLAAQHGQTVIEHRFEQRLDFPHEIRGGGEA